jgi:hypothetical protein
MHMLDWNTYRQQLLAGVGGFGKLNPDIIKGYTTLSRAGQKAERPANSSRLRSPSPCAATTAASRYIPRRPGNGVRPIGKNSFHVDWTYASSMSASRWSARLPRTQI